ncbi:MAG TPA: CAP domain-containing protein [Candidatus Sulfotelmatobacter sp.]
MLRTPMFVLAFMLGAVVIGAHPTFFGAPAAAANPAAAQLAQGATLKPVAATSADIPFNSEEFQTEQQLLQFANQDRAQAGLPSFTLDSSLSHAARIHAQAMTDARQLSHQFTGESSLAQRLAAATKLQLDQEGENVALDYDAQGAEHHLMLSPPHRANLLNPAYNVIGLGIVQSGDHLYIVQDFGHALPNYSPAEVKDQIAAAVADMRRQSGQPALARRDLPIADQAACSMTEADKLGTSPIHQLAQRYTVLTFTSLHPETLPAEGHRAIASPNLRSFSIGECYGKTETYPTGVYWVVLSLD